MAGKASETFKRQFKERLKGMMKEDIDKAVDAFVDELTDDAECKGADSSTLPEGAETNVEKGVGEDFSHTLEFKKEFSKDTIKFIRSMIG